MGDDERDRFVGWYGEAHPRVVTSLLLLTGDVDVAHEVADEAFARAFLHWGRVSQMASPTGWTCRVAFNVLRRRGRRAQMEAALLRRRVPVPDVPPPAGEAWERLRQALDEMTYRSGLVSQLDWRPDPIGNPWARAVRAGESGFEDAGTGWVRDPMPGHFPG